MRHGSLFSGIGGFDLASEWMGWENVFHCEWNEFGKKVLHHYWPNAESFDDITKTDFTKYANKIDILTGGFPCQPYSQAGKRQGKEDSRHLWPEMLRAIREIKPKYIVGENVFGLLNWNGGMVFDEVHTDLEFEGYEVQAVVIPAAAVNAPHGRDRVWFVATNTSSNGGQENPKSKREKNEENTKQSKCLYNYGIASNTEFKPTGSDGGTNDKTQGDVRRGNEGDVFGTLRGDGVTTDTNGISNRGKSKQSRTAHQQGRSGETNTRIGNEGEQQFIRDITSEGIDSNADLSRCQAKGEQSKSTTQNKRIEHLRSGWEQFPTQSPICGGNDGLPTELDGITFSKWRNESIKAYGNAIVPQVAYQIFKAIQETI